MALAPPPDLWLPSRPAIVRAAEGDLQKLAPWGQFKKQNKAMLLVPPIGWRTGVSALSYIASTTSTGPTLTLPAAINAGDLLTLFHFGAKPAASPSVAAGDNGQAAVTGSFQFMGLGIGTASPERIVVAAIGAASGNTISNVRIGGVNATLIDEYNSGSYPHLTLWEAVVPTGATADVRGDASGSVYNMYCQVDAIYGCAPGAVDYAQTHISGGSNLSDANVTVPSGGVGVWAAMGHGSGGGGTGTFNWTNATKRSDFTSPDNYMSIGTAYTLTAGTPSISASTGIGYKTMIGAAWAPLANVQQVPSGFSEIFAPVASAGAVLSAHYKIASGSEDGAAVNVNKGGTRSGSICMQYRGDVPLVGANFGNSGLTWTDADPAAETVAVGALSRPCLAWGIYASGDGAVSPRTVTGPAAAHEIAAGTYLYVKDWIFAAAQADFTIDMDDEGTNNGLVAVWATP